MMALLCVVMTCGVNKGFTFFAGFWQAYVFFKCISLEMVLSRSCVQPAVGSSHWGNCSARRTFITPAGVLKILP